MEKETENNLEDRQASIEFEDIKEQSNLEYARRIRSQDEKYDKFGQEKLPDIELTGIYKESSLADKIERRRALGLSPVSMFSDIDNTFYRKGEAETTEKLSEILNRNNWGIIYITGRDFPMVDNQEDLPKADVVVGAVGTEIFVRDKEGGYQQDEEFRQLLLNTWDREEVYLQAQEIVERSQEKLKFQGRDVPGAYNPEDPKSEPPQDFKISFNVFGSPEDAKQASDA